MSKKQKKILEMLISNKINVDEACWLLFVAEPESNSREDTPQLRTSKVTQSRYLRTCVMPGFQRFR
jgi:hypothetical protein